MLLRSPKRCGSTADVRHLIAPFLQNQCLRQLLKQ